LTDTPKRVAERNAILRVAESRNTWACCAPETHTLEDAMSPAYLWAKAREIRPGDFFEVRHERHAFLVRGYVVDLDHDAKTLSFKLLPGYPVDLRDMELIACDWSGATVTQEAPPYNWCIRLGGAIAKSDFSSESRATEWLNAKQRIAREGVSA
jgi:hypothetical protein